MEIRVDSPNIEVGDKAVVPWGRGTRDGIVRQVLGDWVLVEIQRTEAHLHPFRWKGRKTEIVSAWRAKDESQVASPPEAGEGKTEAGR